jgi:uncharacterized small protein (DUF1192 family)
LAESEKRTSIAYLKRLEEEGATSVQEGVEILAKLEVAEKAVEEGRQRETLLMEEVERLKVDRTVSPEVASREAEVLELRERIGALEKEVEEAQARMSRMSAAVPSGYKRASTDMSDVDRTDDSKRKMRKTRVEALQGSGGTLVLFAIKWASQADSIQE